VSQQILRCGTCSSYSDGQCTNPKLREPRGKTRAEDELVYSYDEGGVFYVGPNFGCIHHSPSKAVSAPALHPGDNWLDMSTEPPTLRKRNAANSGWEPPRET
jgi:hypothetical protein